MHTLSQTPVDTPPFDLDGRAAVAEDGVGEHGPAVELREDARVAQPRHVHPAGVSPARPQPRPFGGQGH